DTLRAGHEPVGGLLVLAGTGDVYAAVGERAVALVQDFAAVVFGAKLVGGVLDADEHFLAGVTGALGHCAGLQHRLRKLPPVRLAQQVSLLRPGHRPRRRVGEARVVGTHDLAAGAHLVTIARGFDADPVTGPAD